MKKLKYSKKLLNESKTFIQLIENYCNKMNKEYLKNVNILLKKIADGEKLNFDDLKEKYLNQSVQKETITDELTLTPTETEDTEKDFDEIILDKIIIDDTHYYYEN